IVVLIYKVAPPLRLRSELALSLALVALGVAYVRMAVGGQGRMNRADRCSAGSPDAQARGDAGRRSKMSVCMQAPNGPSTSDSSPRVTPVPDRPLPSPRSAGSTAGAASARTSP